jgi:IclR helix-turn-helix domain
MPEPVRKSRRGGQGKPVLVELTPAQLDRVVRDVAGTGNMAALLSGLSDMRDTLQHPPWQLDDPRFSRSLLAGLLLLAAFPADGSYMGSAELARMLDMTVSTAHRYISTLVVVGLLERDPVTRKYRLADAG